MGKVIAISNRKGGVGKTTCTVNIGAALAIKGKKVLLVDLDPQSSLSKSVGIRDPELSSYELLKQECTAQEAIVSLPGYDIIAAKNDLAGAEGELLGETGREWILKEAIQPVISNYDYVFLDCPPSLGLLTINALTAADDLFVPLVAEPMSLEGLSTLLDTVEKVQKRINKNLRIAGVLMTKFNSRRKISHEIVETIRSHFPAAVFATPIRDNVALAESPGHGLDIFQYDSKSSGAQDFLEIASEIILREE